MPPDTKEQPSAPRQRAGLGVAGWDRSWKCAPSGDPAGSGEVSASRPRSGGARVEGSLELLGRSFQVRGGPRALVPPLSCPLPPLPGDFCRPQDCGRGRGVPALGGAGAAGCAGTRRRPPHPVPLPLPRLLPGADLRASPPS